MTASLAPVAPVALAPVSKLMATFAKLDKACDILPLARRIELSDDDDRPLACEWHLDTLVLGELHFIACAALVDMTEQVDPRSRRLDAEREPRDGAGPAVRLLCAAVEADNPDQLSDLLSVLGY